MKIKVFSLILMCITCTAVRTSSYEQLNERVTNFLREASVKETEPVKDIFKELENCSDPRGALLALKLGNFILESCKDDNHLMLIADYVEHMVMKIKQGTITNEKFIQTLTTLIENGIKEPTLEARLKALRKDITFKDGSPAKQKGTPAFRRTGSTMDRRASMPPTTSSKKAESSATLNQSFPGTTTSHEQDLATSEEEIEIFEEDIKDPQPTTNAVDATRASKEAQLKIAQETNQREKENARRQQEEREKQEKENQTARAALAQQKAEAEARLEKEQKEKTQREAKAKQDAAEKARLEKEKNDQNPGKKSIKTSFTKKAVVTTLVSGIIAMIAMEYLGGNPAKKLQKGAASFKDTLTELLGRRQG